MKILITVIVAFVFSVTSINAQTINGKLISEIDVEYIMIVGQAKFLSNKVTIKIDFGQFNKFFSMKDQRVKDKDGKPLTLNSMIDALNFMTKNGYEFVDAYAITISNQNVYHFLMKKRNIDESVNTVIEGLNSDKN